MTSSRNPVSPAQRLAHLRALLDEERLRREVDERVDTAVRQFHVEARQPFSHRHFQHVIGAFVRHVYEHGVRCPQRLSPQQALGEATAILDLGYPDLASSRYDAAVLDGSDSDQNGLVAVLEQMALLIKERERRKYVRCALARWLDPSDWQSNCKIAELQLGRVWPAGAERCAAGQFADEIPRLIAAELSTDAQLRQLAAAALHSLTL